MGAIAVDIQAQVLFFYNLVSFTIDILRLDSKEHITIVDEVGDVFTIRRDPYYRYVVREF